MALAASTYSLPQLFGLDIDNFDVILSSTTKTDELVNYLSSKGYTQANLYNLHQVLGSTTLKTKLAAFIPRLHAKGIKVGAIRSSYSSFKTTIDWCTSTGLWFDELNLEKEFWNGDGTFSDWLLQLDQTNIYANSKQVRSKFLLTAYIGWFASGQYDQQALELVKRLDVIQVHDYRVKPDESYTRSRLTSLSKGAHQIGKVQKIIPLFSAEPEFLATYLQTHSQQDVVNSYMTSYNADTLIPYKSNLSLNGSWWFAYNDIKVVKP